jgi:hypothetical protein
MAAIAAKSSKRITHYPVRVTLRDATRDPDSSAFAKPGPPAAGMEQIASTK